MLEKLTPQQRSLILLVELLAIVVTVGFIVQIYLQKKVDTLIQPSPSPQAQVIASPIPSPTIGPKTVGVVSPDGKTVNTGVKTETTASTANEAEIADERTELIAKMPLKNSSCAVTYDYKNLVFNAVIHTPTEKNLKNCQAVLTGSYPLIPKEEFVFTNE